MVLFVRTETAPTMVMGPIALECVVYSVGASPGSVVIAVYTKDAMTTISAVGDMAISVGHA